MVRVKREGKSTMVCRRKCAIPPITFPDSKGLLVRTGGIWDILSWHRAQLWMFLKLRAWSDLELYAKVFRAARNMKVADTLDWAGPALQEEDKRDANEYLQKAIAKAKEEQ